MTNRDRQLALSREYADIWQSDLRYWVTNELSMWARFKRAQIAAKASEVRMLALTARIALRPAVSPTGARQADPDGSAEGR